jgi:hypothetical protein
MVLTRFNNKGAAVITKNLSCLISGTPC